MTITISRTHLRLLAVVGWFVGVFPILAWGVLDVTFGAHATYWQVLLPFLLVYYLIATVYWIYQIGNTAEQQKMVAPELKGMVGNMS